MLLRKINKQWAKEGGKQCLISLPVIAVVSHTQWSRQVTCVFPSYVISLTRAVRTNSIVSLSRPSPREG